MKLSNHLHMQRSIFISWLLSYILILAVALIICMFTYWEFVNVLKSEISNAYMTSTKQLQQVVDSSLNDIQSVGMEASFDNRISKLMSLKNSMNADNRIDMVNTINYLKSYKIANGIIDKFYIYFKYNNIIVSNIASYPPEDFYNIYYKDYNIDYDNWNKLLESKHLQDYLSLTYKDQKKDVKTGILFMQSLPITQRNPEDATLVIEMNSDALQNYIQGLKSVPDSSIYIKDKNNNILVGTNKMSIPESLSYDKLNKPQDILYLNINNHNEVVSYVKSDITDWIYISIIPESIYLERVTYVYRIVFICIMLCIFVGGIVAYILAKRSYNPVDNLMKIFKIKPEMVRESGFNEYGIIEKSIMEIISEKEKVYNKLDQQMDVLKNNFLTRLIKGRIGINISMQDACQSYNLYLNKKYFTVILIFIEDFGSLYYDKLGTDNKSEDAINIVHSIIKKVIEETIGEKYNVYVAIVNDMPVCLVNYSEDSQNDIKQELSRMIMKASNITEGEYSILFSAAIGGSSKSIENIPKSYQEAIEALEYKMLVGNGRMIHYDELAYSRNRNHNTSSYINEEQQFINCVRAGDYKNAKIILASIFENNFSKDLPSIQLVKCRMFGLINIMLNAIGEISATLENSFIIDMNLDNQLLACKTVKELENKMLCILDKVENYISEKKISGDSEIYDKIVAFIDDNYTNAELSVSMIADQFNMNVVGISRFFKKKTSLGMLDYIHKLRIEKAKALLIKEKTSIKDVSEKVGFSNSAAFIRVFKKYEGITPGRLK